METASSGGPPSLLSANPYSLGILTEWKQLPDTYVPDLLITSLLARDIN